MLNKKAAIVALLIITAICAMSSANANANNEIFNNKAFVGLDVQKVDLKQAYSLGRGYDLVIENLTGISLFGGYRWDREALELGVTHIRTVNYIVRMPIFSTLISYNMTIRNWNAYLDALYFYPVSDSLELKGLVGIGVLTTDYDRSEGNSSEIGLRLGAGLQYNVDDGWGYSLMYKYQSGNRFFSDMHTIALGMACHF